MHRPPAALKPGEQTVKSLKGAVARKSAREAALTADKAGAEATVE
jgi:hypothetical protein